MSELYTLQILNSFMYELEVTIAKNANYPRVGPIIEVRLALQRALNSYNNQHNPEAQRDPSKPSE